ncbi:hypothetical protein GGR52DRAFT_574104 [Hypoxylon sp. FL1284]|nr:hypothetical protein GGR52DRAFT_574104 [Hypoxylon sp. FL1284]
MSTQKWERRNVPRQFHSKSRNSCSNCRRRRVKCNLQSPMCNNCHRRKELCSYSQLDARDRIPAADLNTRADTYAGYAGASVAAESSLPLVWTDCQVHPKLLYNEGIIRLPCGMGRGAGDPITWAMEKTFSLLWLSNTEKSIFALELSHHASTFQYVRTTITALLTLHQWSGCQNPSRTSLYADAYQYHIEASTLFRKSQAEVNDANWFATLMFGLGVIIFQFATVLKVSDGSEDYLEMLHVLRSSCSLATEIGPFVQTSPIMFLTGRYLRWLNSHLDETTWNAVCGLDSLEYPADTTDETRSACLQSITALKEWAVRVDGYPGTWRQYIEWPAIVSKQYLDALSSRHPVALVVFVYWCSIMHRSPKRWFMVGWANRAADAAMRHLGKEWDAVLEFPRATLASEPTSVKTFALGLDHFVNLNISPSISPQ